MISLIQHFEADFVKSQPQNPEFRNNPEYKGLIPEIEVKLLQLVLYHYLLPYFHHMYYWDLRIQTLLPEKESPMLYHLLDENSKF